MASTAWASATHTKPEMRTRASVSAARQGGQAERQHGHDDAGQRAGGRDLQLGLRRLWLLGEHGHAPEDPQRDGLDLQAMPARDEGVGQLVHDQTAEEQDDDGDADGPVRAGAVAGKAGLETGGERPRRQQAEREE